MGAFHHNSATRFNVKLDLHEIHLELITLTFCYNSVKQFVKLGPAEIIFRLKYELVI